MNYEDLITRMLAAALKVCSALGIGFQEIKFPSHEFVC